MPSVCVRDLKPRYQVIRRFLLILFLPICILMLFCAIYATYLTINTWNCQQTDNLNQNSSNNGPNQVKCHTILDSISGQLSHLIPQRKILLVIRTGSLINTLSTYISAWIAIYRLSFLPMVWLSIVSMASFFITLNFSIIFGPMTGINNFELVPIFIGLELHPMIVTSIVLALDLLISIISVSLIISGYKKSYQ